MPARFNITQDIQPLTTFRNNSVKLIRQLKATQRPIILTVNGKPEAVLQDPTAYQRLLDLAAASDASEGIRQGLADLAAGRVRPLDEVFDEMRAKYAIPR
jgi:prevent-host-death family protein